MKSSKLFKELKRFIARTPIIGQVVLIPIRIKILYQYFHGLLFKIIKWLLKSKETTNFTYDLEESNKRYLASMIADILNVKYEKVMMYIHEIEDDAELKQHIKNTTLMSDQSFKADIEVKLGRRIGWYAFARILKPKVIVETGVDKGLGSCVLTAALKRNKEEGFIGKYLGTDIDPKAGYLLSGKYSVLGQILYGDSIQSLKQINDPIDLFINDSDHSSKYEAEEYEIISDKLTKQAIILGDNSHCTDELLKFSLKTNRHFVFFQERPSNHWYPGAGIGISFIKPVNQ